MVLLWTLKLIFKYLKYEKFSARFETSVNQAQTLTDLCSEEV